jgi:NitT/TauT family transport system substrate-binding protein
MVTVNQGFMQKNSVATKTALRAILQVTDLCAAQPANAAQLLVDRGFAPDYQYALSAVQQIPYNHCRTFNSEDTLRYYGLLLGEVGMVKSTPEQLIKTGTDWTFLNQLKTELPATPAPASFASARNLLCAIDSSRMAGARRRGSAE